MSEGRCLVKLADAGGRDEIARLRYRVYAEELGQYPRSSDETVRDAVDAHGEYIVVEEADRLVGFVGVTPPTAPMLGIEKYLSRHTLPFEIDATTFEVRLLTVLAPHRHGDVATRLMYAALRWIEANGGRRLVAIGRREVLGLYLRCGLRETGVPLRLGEVDYELLAGSVDDVRRYADASAILRRLERSTDWQLGIPFRLPAPCFHGGASVEETLEGRDRIIGADVLDAWFPPAPEVLDVLREKLSWAVSSSPPAAPRRLIETIARVRGVPPECVLAGAGSSDLIFRALPLWLTRASRVLILDPMYGEYAHVLERVVGCRVDRLVLRRENDYDVSDGELAAALARGYDLVVVVNPNSPTGRHLSRARLIELLSHVPPKTRVWIDETYVEYAGPGASLETFACTRPNVYVCKSMSKAYALSGLRVAYLCASSHRLEELRAVTPPWIVGLPAQLAAMAALDSGEYYAARYAETHQLREEMASQLRGLGLDVVPGMASFLLAHLPVDGPDAATVVARCVREGLYLRDAAAMGRSMGRHALRIAVKDRPTNERIVEIVASVLGAQAPSGSQRSMSSA